MFGAIYDLTDYRSTLGAATADFLAGNIVSNDLAGPLATVSCWTSIGLTGSCLIRI